MLLGAYRPGSVEDFERVRRARLVRRAQATVSSAVYQSPRLAVPELVDDPIDVLFREHRLIARARPHLYVLPDPEYRSVELKGTPERRRKRSLVAGLSTALTLKGAMVLTAAAAALATGGLLATTHAAPPRTHLSEPAPSVSVPRTMPATSRGVVLTCPTGSRAAVASGSGSAGCGEAHSAAAAALPAPLAIPTSVARPPLVAPAAPPPTTLASQPRAAAVGGNQGQARTHQKGQDGQGHGHSDDKGTAGPTPAQPSAARAQPTGPGEGALPTSAAAGGAPSATGGGHAAAPGGAHSATAASGDESANHAPTGAASGKD